MFEELLLAAAGRHGAVVKSQDTDPPVFEPWMAQTDRPPLTPSAYVWRTDRPDAARTCIQQRGANPTLHKRRDAVESITLADAAEVDLNTRSDKANRTGYLIEQQLVAANERFCLFYFLSFGNATFPSQKTPTACQWAGSYIESAFGFASQELAESKQIKERLLYANEIRSGVSVDMADLAVDSEYCQLRLERCNCVQSLCC